MESLVHKCHGSIKHALISRLHSTIGQVVMSVQVQLAFYKQDVRAAAQLYRRVAAGCEASGQLDDAEIYYIKAGLPVDAAQMWLRAKQWARAVQVASQHLPGTAAHVRACALCSPF